MYCQECERNTGNIISKKGKYMCSECGSEKSPEKQPYIKGRRNSEPRPQPSASYIMPPPPHVMGHNMVDGVHVPPHLYPLVVIEGRVDKNKLKEMILAEHGL